MLGSGVKHDQSKPRWALIPFDALAEVVKVITFGAHKYEPNNWRLVENGKERYLSAVFRHLSEHAQGNLRDEETGLMHLAHAGCGVLFLLHYYLREQPNGEAADEASECGETGQAGTLDYTGPVLGVDTECA